MSVRRAVVAVTLALAAAFPPAGIAAAQSDEERAGANLTGCEGAAVSFDANGEERDRVSAPGGPGSSSDSPFHVAPDGSVAWIGSTDRVIRDFSWNVKLAGVTVRSGSAANAHAQTSHEGVEDVGDYLPFTITGLYHVEFHLSGEGGECKGDLWVKLDGNPFATVPWLVAAGLILAGGAGLWWGRPTRREKPKPSLTTEGVAE